MLETDEIAALKQVMGVSPRVQFYNDDTANAVALPRQQYDHFDGTILVGIKMMSEVPSTFDYTALYGVMGHEASHILQFTRNPEWISGGKAAELHADFMGGYYISTRTWKYKQLNLNRDAFGDLLFTLGDCDFNTPSHHGTPDERRNAMEAGYEIARWNSNVSVDEAYQAGLAWVAK